MSRSPYYPRKRTRVYTTKQKPSPQNPSADRPRRDLHCSICHADIPLIERDGLYYLQGPLGFFCQAIPSTVCPWKLRLENGTPGQRDAALSPDCPGGEVDSARVDSEDVV
jgi:hypothetical protein